MSIRTKIDTIPFEKREKMSLDLSIKLEVSKYGSFGKPQYFDAYEINGDEVSIPFAYAINTMKFPKPKADNYEKISDPYFSGALREPQKVVKDEAIKNLNSFGACLISCYPGFGKTLTSIYISSKIKLKTIIIVNKIKWKITIIIILII